MGKEYYYIYCQGILGVKTNLRDFKWIYGSCAPLSTKEAYEACKIKFDVCVKPERQLAQRSNADGRFQSYRWYRDSATFSCRRTLIPYYEIGYDIQIQGNTVFAEIGEHYHRIVKHRTMNLHGTYYLLSDLANILLLKNGLLTFYASAVYSDCLKKGVVCFAPPSTGKTYTAISLCETYGYQFVSEDVVVFDGSAVYSCPWTSSYRKGAGSVLDSSGALRCVKGGIPENNIPKCEVTDLIALSLGESRVYAEKDRFFGRIAMLNGYLFGYYATPIVKMLGYFEADYDRPWNLYAEEMLRRAVEAYSCYNIQSEESVDFAARIHQILSDETI